MKTSRPAWLNKKINLKSCSELKKRLSDLGLNTVCEEALCPNIGECFGKAQATFLILGKVCTRQCAFCGVKRGRTEPVDPLEPARVAEGVKRLGLKHVVITSVTRDDLADGGAQGFVDTIAALKKLEPKVTIEILTPDFALNKEAIKKVVDAGPDIFAHNIETVRGLYDKARKGADYDRSLALLRLIKKYGGLMRTKSGIMVGLGERETEVKETLRDIADTGCDYLSIGQYLSPSREHLAVKEYVLPGAFERYRDIALGMGFRSVMSGPYVRSSFSAAEYIAAE